jgi:hypothetical protein
MFPGCEVLDLAGPLQTFHDANACGARYHLSLAATSPQIDTAQLLSVAALSCLPKEVHADDLIVVPCHDVRRISPPAGLIRVSVGLEASCDLLAGRPSARRRISSRGSAKAGWQGLRNRCKAEKVEGSVRYSTYCS